MSAGLYSLRPRGKAEPTTSDSTAISTTPKSKTKAKVIKQSLKGKEASKPVGVSNEGEFEIKEGQDQTSSLSEASDSDNNKDKKVEDVKNKVGGVTGVTKRPLVSIYKEDSQVESSDEDLDNDTDSDDYKAKTKKNKIRKNSISSGRGGKRVASHSRSNSKVQTQAPSSSSKLISGPDFLLLASAIHTPVLQNYYNNSMAMYQAARLQATRDLSLQTQSQRTVESVVLMLSNQPQRGLEAAFCLSMNRYSAFCTMIDVPAFPITIQKVSLHFARILPTPLGSSIRKLIPPSDIHALPVIAIPGEIIINQGNNIYPPPLEAGEGYRVTRELVRNWGEALAYCQVSTKMIWDPILLRQVDSERIGIGEGIREVNPSIMNSMAMKEILDGMEIVDKEFDKGLRLMENSDLSISGPVIHPVKSKVTKLPKVKAPPKSKTIRTAKGKGKEVIEQVPIQPAQVLPSPQLESTDSLQYQNYEEPDKKKIKWNKGGIEVQRPIGSSSYSNSEASPSLVDSMIQRTLSTSPEYMRSPASVNRGLPIPLAVEPPPFITPKAPILPSAMATSTSNPPAIENSPPSTTTNYHRNASPPLNPTPTPNPTNTVVEEPWKRILNPTPSQPTLDSISNSSSSTTSRIQPNNDDDSPGYISRIMTSEDQSQHNKAWGTQPNLMKPPQYYRQPSTHSNLATSPILNSPPPPIPQTQIQPPQLLSTVYSNPPTIIPRISPVSAGINIEPRIFNILKAAEGVRKNSNDESSWSSIQNQSKINTKFGESSARGSQLEENGEGDERAEESTTRKVDPIPENNQPEVIESSSIVDEPRSLSSDIRTPQLTLNTSNIRPAQQNIPTPSPSSNNASPTIPFAHYPNYSLRPIPAAIPSSQFQQQQMSHLQSQSQQRILSPSQQQLLRSTQSQLPVATTISNSRQSWIHNPAVSNITGIHTNIPGSSVINNPYYHHQQQQQQQLKQHQQQQQQYVQPAIVPSQQWSSPAAYNQPSHQLSQSHLYSNVPYPPQQYNQSQYNQSQFQQPVENYYNSMTANNYSSPLPPRNELQQQSSSATDPYYDVRRLQLNQHNNNSGPMMQYSNPQQLNHYESGRSSFPIHSNSTRTTPENSLLSNYAGNMNFSNNSNGHSSFNTGTPASPHITPSPHLATSSHIQNFSGNQQFGGSNETARVVNDDESQGETQKYNL